MQKLYVLLLLILAIAFQQKAQETISPELWPADMVCGKVPVIRIATEGGVPIVDKVTQIPATLSLTVPDGYKTMQGETPQELSDIALTIRGRGNATWRSAKKPYKLKFSQKTDLLGLPQHKHFSLLAYPGYLNYVSAVTGLEASRCTEVKWAPHAEPVELILNDVYMGRYFVVENIKISSNRLDIFEQGDQCEDPELVPYGWLVEIDNNEDECQFRIPETENSELWITYHSPEDLSDMQLEWLTEEFIKLNNAVYADETSEKTWAQYIDAGSAARYFIVRELFSDPDGYSGSMYLHRDKGENALWHFGPIWDIASTHSDKDAWIYDSKVHYGLHWFPQLMKTRSFREALVDQWSIFRSNEQLIYEYLDRLGTYVAPTDEANYLRWEGLEASTPALRCTAFYKQLIARTTEWIDMAVRQIEYELSGVEQIETALPLSIDGRTVRLNPGVIASEINVYNLSGRLVAATSLAAGEAHTFADLTPGVYIIRNTVNGNTLPAATTFTIR